jgi:aspartyl-tRNA synthetase
MEMAFTGEEHVMDLTETVIKTVFGDTAGIQLGHKTPFLKMTYQHAMATYGSDKPDLRLGAEVGAPFPFHGSLFSNLRRYTRSQTGYPKTSSAKSPT